MTIKTSTLLYLLIVSVCFSVNSKAETNYPFSRLFTTSAERAYLDKLKQKINSNRANQVEITQDNAPNGQEIINNKGALLRLSGFIKRSDGQQQVWVNDKKLVNSDYLSGQLSSIKKSTINLKTKNKQIFIKVGQSWDPPKNEIIHVYKTK